jgi:hypothetical protein
MKKEIFESLLLKAGNAHSTVLPTPSTVLLTMIITGEIKGVNTRDQKTTPGTVCMKP